MRILLTGGTGFLGKHLVSRFVHSGIEVGVLSRCVKKAQKVLPANVRFYEWPMPHNTLAPKEAFDKVSVVINLAGESLAKKRWTKKQKKRIEESRVLTTASLMMSIETYRVSSLKTLISSSAIGYYPSVVGEKMDEDFESGTSFVARVCRNWEDQVMKVSLPKKVRKVIFRWGVVLGYEAGLLREMIGMLDKHRGAVLGSGKQLINWITVNDVGELILKAIHDKRYGGIYNAVTPYPVSHKTFVQLLAKHLKRRVWLRVPAGLIKGLLGRERAGLLLDQQHIHPQGLLDLKFPYLYTRLHEAIEGLLPKY